ncbi:hypothetical protein T190607A02C_110004 [Tenacibaculum sp. 190524A02b]
MANGNTKFGLLENKKPTQKFERENCYEKEKVSRTSPRHYKFITLFNSYQTKFYFF